MTLSETGAEVADASLILVYPTSQPDLELALACSTPFVDPAAGSKVLTVNLHDLLSDAATDVAYTVVFKAGALKDSDGKLNAKTTVTFKY